MEPTSAATARGTEIEIEIESADIDAVRGRPTRKTGRGTERGETGTAIATMVVTVDETATATATRMAAGPGTRSEVVARAGATTTIRGIEEAGEALMAAPRGPPHVPRGRRTTGAREA